MKMLRDLVLVKIDEEKESKGGILFVPGTGNQKLMAKVISVGPGIYNGNKFCECSVKQGDVVYISGKAPKEEIQLNGEDLHIISEADIFGVVPE